MICLTMSWVYQKTLIIISISTGGRESEACTQEKETESEKYAAVSQMRWVAGEKY